MRGTKSLGVCLLCCLLSTEAAALEGVCKEIQKADRSGLTIGIASSKSVALPIQNRINQTPQFSYKLAKVASGDTVTKLAADNSFHPDQYNLALIANLNPQLKNLDSITPGQFIRIPIVVGGMKVQIGDKVYGYKLRQTLTQSITKFDAKSAVRRTNRAFARAKSRSAPGANWKLMDRTLMKIQSSLEESGTLKTFDFNKVQAAIAVQMGSAQLIRLMNSYGTPGSKAFLAPRYITNIAVAIAQRVESLEKGNAQIIVRTRSPYGAKLDGLRVFRASDASHLVGCSDVTKVEFDTVSYEARAVMPIARWWIWAEDPIGTKSDSREIDVHKSKIIDFTVKWKN